MPVITTQFPARISTANLNGVNGFAIMDFPSSYGGESVSGAGDVNGDGIVDLIIGAPFTSSNRGMSYVLFGKSGIGSSGSVSVSSLSGSNGFVITGFPINSRGGWSVSGAGDVNGDGIADLVVGAPDVAPCPSYCTGAGYVIFGKVDLGSSGRLNVSSLTGANGFIITGFPFFSGSGGGWSVNGAGDINGDGIADLVVGAPYVSNESGVSYVIFGKADLGSSGRFNVSSLTGMNGFIITGFPAYSRGGFSVSGAGDVNADDIADLVIGAPRSIQSAGSVYVIFGKSDIGSSGSINVSNLTGSNGFVINGFPAGNIGGYSVSGADDINADGIADLVIGAPGSHFDTAYVIFGKSELGSSGSINIAGITGTNGFAIQPSVWTSNAVQSVGEARDINGDGIADLVVGLTAPGSTLAEVSVIFGKPNLVSSGNLRMVDLNGMNGFSISFSVFFSGGGYSVSGVGDINADGGSDLLVGAPYSGVSYVIFGEPVLLLSRNQLIINEGQTLIFDSRYLNATNSKNPSKDHSLQFTISGIQHGYFFSLSNPSIFLTSFSQYQVRSGQIQFAHDGSGWAPVYNISMEYPGMFASTLSQEAAITFHQSFVLTNNTLTINQGHTVVLTSNNLSASDLYNSANDPNLVFSVSNVQHGYFALTSAPGVVITRFTQAQVQNGDVQFLHDGSISPPGYTVIVLNGAGRTKPQVCIISFDIPPVLINNNLKVNQGQAITLSSNNLSAIDPFATESELVFTISKLQHGYFAVVSIPTTSIINFTQAQVNNGEVQFVPDGTNKAPSYSVLVSSRMPAVMGPQPAVITFNDIPVIVINQLKVTQGETVILGTGDLSATDQETSAGELVFTASDLSHGHFEDITTPGIATTVFAQQRVISGGMKFVTDGSADAPVYSMSVSDGILSSPSSKAIVNFIPKHEETPTQSDPVRNAIIGGVVSGVVGLGFFAVKVCLERRTARSLQSALEGGKSETERRLITYQKEVIKPIANKVFDRIKTTWFLGYRSDKDTKAYVSAIESIVGKLADLGVDLDLSQMNATQQNKLLNEIAKQTRLQVVADYSCCSCAYLGSFFKPEARPQQLEDSADVIAAAVQAVMRSSSQTSSIKPTQRQAVEPTEMQEINVSDTLAG